MTSLNLSKRRRTAKSHQEFSCDVFSKAGLIYDFEFK